MIKNYNVYRFFDHPNYEKRRKERWDRHRQQEEGMRQRIDQMEIEIKQQLQAKINKPAATTTEECRQLDMIVFKTFARHRATTGEKAQLDWRLLFLYNPKYFIECCRKPPYFSYGNIRQQP